MKMIFVELPPFDRFRQQYLSDEMFRALQDELLENPEKGDLIQGTGGLRKIRVGDRIRKIGKRSAYRVIYYWQDSQQRCWLFAGYGKNEQVDLTAEQRRHLSQVLQRIKDLMEQIP